MREENNLCLKCGKCCTVHGIRCRYLNEDNTCNTYRNRLGKLTHRIHGISYYCVLRIDQLKEIAGCPYNKAIEKRMIDCGYGATKEKTIEGKKIFIKESGY